MSPVPRSGSILLILAGASLGVVTCSDGIDPPDGGGPPAGTTSGRDGNTFDHDRDGTSLGDLLERIDDEGPARFTSRVHSCAKVRYATLGNVLASLGVDLASAAPLSAGALYHAAAPAYGSPSYANRLREPISITTSSASAEFDIFAAAAGEVTAALTRLPRCQVGGAPGPALFDANNHCNPDAITCMIGTPAQAGHVDLCSRSVGLASDPEIGKRLAVAALLAAAYTCE
jgi:hypothetical protein